MIEQTIRRQGVRDTLRADNIFMNVLLLGPNLGINGFSFIPKVYNLVGAICPEL